MPIASLTMGTGPSRTFIFWAVDAECSRMLENAMCYRLVFWRAFALLYPKIHAPPRDSFPEERRLVTFSFINTH